jgi:hypothetical protein
MALVLKDEQRTARKVHDCDASYHWRNYGPPADVELSAGDLRAVEDAKADEWKIKPGQRYRYVVQREGRQLEAYRARLDMDRLCQAHDLYDDA